jgi:hypothetical protein
MEYGDLVQFERGIQTLLHGVPTGAPVLRPAPLQRLAEQIFQRTPQEGAIDIDAWAKRLASDVARLTD